MIGVTSLHRDHHAMDADPVPRVSAVPVPPAAGAQTGAPWSPAAGALGPGTTAGAGWLGLLFAGFWLIFLIDPVRAALERGTRRDYAGIVVLVAFAVLYLAATRSVRRYFRAEDEDPPAIRTLVAGGVALVVLAGAAVALLGLDGLNTAPYLAVVGLLVFGRWGVLWIIALATTAEVVTRAYTGDWTSNAGAATATLAAGFSMWGISLMIQRNLQQVRTREAQAALAVEHERNRFARDLHDILGHSLTVMTVKAELAGRLMDVEDPRARHEVDDLERLARDALADVRRTVEGYRDITLPGELARARAALETAGIVADLPNTAEAARSDLRELFAWTVREGVTNVVRHSGATSCTVTIDPTSVSVTDDGNGAAHPAYRGGNGLRGLTERAAANGAHVTTDVLRPHGFRLTVAADRPAGEAA